MNPKVFFVVGPTACGKSDFAVELAEKTKSEIINCDSVQFYDGVDIGAAKPTREMLSRVVHHLVGHVAKGQSYTAGDFRRAALSVMKPGQTYLAVGGSGFHVQALERGMYDVPEIPPEIRDQLEDEADRDLPKLHHELHARDPEASQKIEPADRYRIVRALEILRANPAEETLSQIRARFERERAPAPFANLGKIGLFRPRAILRTRIETRTRLMIEQGLVAEVESLRAEGLKTWAPMKSVGYKEVQAYLDGELERDKLEPLIVTSTMQLAKRQMTWFKRDAEISWFDTELGWAQPLAHALKRFGD